MKEMKIKQFEEDANMKKVEQIDISEVAEITLPSVEETRNVPQSLRACGDWWVRAPGFFQNLATYVCIDGDVYKIGHEVINVSLAVRPAFRISNLESETGDKVIIGKTLCTVIDKGLVLADYPVCKHRFDSESNDWETSELKAFVNSDEFKAMI